jgi:16S rRNA (cytosine967-C5)-methyltransferase
MKVGAVLVTSILLVEEIIIKKIQAKNILKSHIRSNKYIGAKDRKLLYEITFNMLKKYYGLLCICKIYNINCSVRNLALFNFCNKFKKYNLEDLYEGKYSLKKKDEDFYIFNKAINYKDEIKPRLPIWLEKKTLIKTDIEKKSFYNSILVEPRFDIAINTFKYSRGEVKDKLKKHNIMCGYTKYSTVGITVNDRIPNNNLLKIKSDMFEVQDEGSQLMTLLIGVKTNMKVLDMCAGKGTKTILMSNLSQSKGFITAFDKIKERLSILKRRVIELNLKNINFDVKNQDQFDLVLCDVPCSGIGTWRRRPENIIWLKNEELEKLKLVQNNILLNAAKLCKVGGKIVYITCSLLYDENELQIKSFLENFKNFDVINFRQDIQKYLKKEIFKYNKYGLTLTPDILNTDGYFISMLKKIV